MTAFVVPSRRVLILLAPQGARLGLGFVPQLFPEETGSGGAAGTGAHVWSPSEREFYDEPGTAHRQTQWSDGD